MSAHMLVPRRLGRRVPTFRSVLPRGLDGDVDRLFDGLWRSFGVPETSRAGVGAFNPRVDISESDEEIRLTAELPGLENEDFEVTLDADLLSIKGEKRDEREEKEKGFHRVESLAGSFQRSFRLPAEVDPEAVTARYEKGVLTVTVPRPEEARRETRSIPITSS